MSNEDPTVIRKVAVEDLAIGMYVHDLNCGWWNHPFVGNHFFIDDEKTLEKIRALGVREVYIDPRRKPETEAGADANACPSPRPDAGPSPDEPSDTPSPTGERAASGRGGQRRWTPAAPHKEEVDFGRERGRAIGIQREAIHLINNVMTQARLGQPIALDRTQDVVDHIIDSVSRNRHAILSLSLVRNKDAYTFEHSVSVAVLTVTFARFLGFEGEALRHIGTGALLHDVGKARVRSEILSKPGKLTDTEFAEMRQHVVHTREILGPVTDLSPIAFSAAVEHHEHHDGSGYPLGLRGENISIFGRIVAICDVYDATTADRCYRRAQEPTAVLKQMLSWADRLFEASLVHRFIRCIGIYPVGTLVRLASGHLAVVLSPGEKDLLHPVLRLFFDTQTSAYITPIDVDLAATNDPGHAIASYETPSRWGVTPHAWL